ncbi:MAG: ABC-F family ATP-binding cassette domain-containing protein [Bacillota bacterium]
MTILIVDNLKKSFGARVIFQSVTFSVGQGERMCVVGRNGEGKTTLLRVIAGELEQDEGAFQVVGRRTFGYLSQDVPTFSGTVLEEMLSARKDLQDLALKMKALEEKMAEAAAADASGAGDAGISYTGSGRGHASDLQAIMDDYARATARFETMGGYSLEPRAKAILSGLGFSNDEFEKSPDVLSGGERIRLALAKLLLQEPELLLLDEPTNHLDLGGIEWLEGFLTSYPGAVLLVSHDRYFIDKVAGKILELEGGEAKVYNGNYSAYLVQKDMERQVQAEAYARQQELIARTKAFIQKWKATPSRKNQAWSRQKMLDRMELVEKPKHDKRAMGIRFDLDMESGNEVLLVRDLGRSFHGAGGERVLFHDFTWLVRKGDRVALVGPNGCGKTTLMRCILGEDGDYRGEVRFGQNVVTGYFSQGLDDLRDDLTLLEEVRELGLDNQEARDLLGRFLFSGDEVEKQIGLLSGGERNRLALAKLVVGKANVLLLDEPTNHLDMASREVLESAIRDFPGTLVFASHDRFFIDRLATHLWLWDGDRIHVFKGSYSDYRRKVESGEAVLFEEDLPSFQLISGKKQAVSPQPVQRKEEPRKSATPAPAPAPSAQAERAGKAELAALEDRIDAMERRWDELVKILNDPETYRDSGAAPLKEYKDVERELESLYEKWEELARKAGGSESTAGKS